MTHATLRTVLLAAVVALLPVPAPAAPATLHLTFDADMTPGMLKRLRAGEVTSWYEPGIVDYLREEHLPAIVFVTGMFAETYPEFVQGLAQDPLFTIGAHGYRHSAYARPCYGLSVLRGDTRKREDARAARDAIAKIIGRKPVLFRYPGLCRDAHADAIVREAGFTVDTPDVISGDAFNHNVEAIVAQVLKQAKDGGTVIFHLGGPNAPSTLEALRRVVPALEQRGYVFTGK